MKTFFELIGSSGVALVPPGSSGGNFQQGKLLHVTHDDEGNATRVGRFDDPASLQFFQ